ncbi:unnamed protein product [Vicia faba]|uniref:Dienelactone hydrolase domain-containing protein n=1 Tax=Vicia faba TaxID=3906 RepID=A0AAV0YI37_VICFA|nr:unnamed protein product [Vicia faba]
MFRKRHIMKRNNIFNSVTLALTFLTFVPKIESHIGPPVIHLSPPSYHPLCAPHLALVSYACVVLSFPPGSHPSPIPALPSPSSPDDDEGHQSHHDEADVCVTDSLLSTIAILFVSDIYGYHQAPIIRNLADRVAAAGYYVAVPDYFNGSPFDPENLDRTLPIWMKEHRPDKGLKASQPIIEALKSEGVSTIGAAGFCWGAKTVCDLGKSNFSQVVVLAHPSSITVEDIDGKSNFSQVVVLCRSMDILGSLSMLMITDLERLLLS